MIWPRVERQLVHSSTRSQKGESVLVWRCSAVQLDVSRISKSCVIVAVLPSMIEAEQYFPPKGVSRAPLFGLQRLAGDDEVEVDPGEDFRILGRALGVDFHDAIRDRRAAFAQDVHDVICGAAAGTDQDRFHRAGAKVAPAAFRPRRPSPTRARSRTRPGRRRSRST